MFYQHFTLFLFSRRFRRQDVRNGDPNTLCSGGKTLSLYCNSRTQTFTEIRLMSIGDFKLAFSAL